MLKNNLKAAYIFSYLAVFAIAFFGMSTVASAQFYDDGSYYDGGGYDNSYDPYSFYGDTSGYNDPSDGYYDQPSDWNDYSGYGSGNDYSFDPYASYGYGDNNDYYSGYDNSSYGGYNDGCNSCGGSNNDYYASNSGNNYDSTCYYYDCNGYDYPQYSTCGSGCSTGGTINETVVDVWNSNINTNTNIQYASNTNSDDDNNDDNNNNDKNFSVTCYAEDRTVEVGDKVRWIAEVDGVSDSKVDFKWSGDTDGNDQEVTDHYNKSGTYEAKIRAKYNGHTETDTCTVKVEKDNNNDSNVTLISNTPTGTPASLNSVYLSQVPYTGAADNAKLIGFITMLTLSSLAGAYYIVTRKARSDRKSFIEKFKQSNLTSKA